MKISTSFSHKWKSCRFV